MTELETISLDGIDYARVRVDARVQSSTAEELPDEVRPHIKTTAETKKRFYWQNTENPDIVWVNFILDSEGINKNFDYMPRTQLLASYHTAKYKPMDMEHVVDELNKSLVGLNRLNPGVRNTIFGVMTNTALANYQGKILTQKQIDKIDRKDDPDRPEEERLTVVAWAALYYFLFPNTVKDLVKVINTGNMFVSMERWLRKWDFLVAKGDGSDEFDAVTREEAEKDGTFLKWQQKIRFNGQPVIRRTLGFSYGGVASTANPANELSRFIEKSPEAKVKAAAALVENPVMKQLVLQHDEVVERYAASTSDDERSELRIQHCRIHHAIAAFVG